MGLLNSLTLAQIAEIFQYAALGAMTLIVPYTLFALLRYERHENVRYVRTHESAYYRPSLDYLTWLNFAFLLAILYTVFNFSLRFYLHIENGNDDVGEQPPWSYALSMFGTVLFLLVFVMPSTFLLNLKRHIVREDLRDVSAARLARIEGTVNEIQARGLEDRPAERRDRDDGDKHRNPPESSETHED